MMKLMKATSSETVTKAKLMKLMQANSRVIRKPATWSGCHTVWDTLKIDAPVTVEPGAVFRFKANAGFQIEQDGSLNAAGTAAKPIIFTATDETPGYWYGLYFDSRSSHNRLIHANVLYAGGTTVGHSGITLRRAGGDNNPPSRAVLVKKGALLNVEHSWVAYSGGYGLESLGDLGTFADNRIEHTRVPMRLRLDNVGHVVASNTFSDYDKQQVDVIGNQTLTRDSTWHDIGIPYNLRYFVTIAANLELEPGVVLWMGDGTSMVVNEGASFNAVGTADKPIVIRGRSQHPGYWDSLEISSESGKNVMKFVRISDGGGGNPPYDAIIRVNGHLTLEHSRIANSADIGILIGSANGDLKASDNTFEDNKVNRKVLH